MAQRELHLVPADTLAGERIVDRDGNDLGAIDDLLLDMARGTVAFAVIASDKAQDARRFAVPWGALARDEECRCFVLQPEG